MTILFYVLTALVGTQAASNPWTSECVDVNADPSWKYCIHRQTGSTNPDRVYYFHGRNQSPMTVMDSGGYRAMREAFGSNAPTIVSPSFGRIWLLVHKNSIDRSGLLEYFHQTLYPFLETKLGPLQGRRFVMGESMGGYNSLRVFMEYSSEFSKGAFLCPGVSELSPFAPLSEIREFVRQNNADLNSVLGVALMVKAYVPDEATWATQDPLRIARSWFSRSTPPIFLSVGREDHFGFFPGTRILAELARDRGLDAQWVPVTGRHCSFDGRALGEFLLRN